MHATLPLLSKSEFPSLRRGNLETLQVNLGYRCNQSCLHCHVNAGPKRKEMMDDATLALIPDVMKARNIKNLDLTGGAPELHRGFRNLVKQVSGLGLNVIDRCNLSILFEQDQDDLAEFLAQHRVEIVASLPCYTADNVDAQRGDGVFEKSIAALKILNGLGYGLEGSGLILNLVYNPQGPFLPPGQEGLQSAYKQELQNQYGIEFNQLFALTNMPIKRFGSTLISKGLFDEYMLLLKENYSDSNLMDVMCKSLISVDWQGYLYDCDFNQQLALHSQGFPASNNIPHLRDLLNIDPTGQNIVVADHCYGCTAGQGSSCGGALAD